MRNLENWSQLTPIRDCTDLPYGVSPAIAIFQKNIEDILRGILMVVVRVDDILVSGKSDADHVRNLDSVLTRLSDTGLKLKRQKCKFMQPSVEYLGYLIDKEGIHSMAWKVEAICGAPVPSNITELRSFLGRTQYYAKFIKGYSTLTNPLNILLRKHSVWKWGLEQKATFVELQKQLASAPLLVHFSNTLQLRLACDASTCGVGAVISHVMSDGIKQPITYASRMLTKAERNYSQIEEEALGIVFGVKKFH